MLYSKNSTIEDRIVEMLADKRMSMKSIHAHLRTRSEISLRAVYKAAQKLMDAGVILKVGKYLAIDQEWANRASEMLGSTSLPVLANNERATYTFVSIDNLDAFWKTVMLPLERLEEHSGVFFYNPHNFWAYLPTRKQSEDAYYRHFSGKQYGFFTLGGENTADTEFRRAYQSYNLQIDLRNIPAFRRTNHITIINSRIITVRLSKTLSGRIDRLYASEKSIDDILPEIVNLCTKPGTIRFTIEHNAQKALKMKRVLSRNFYFKQSQ